MTLDKVRYLPHHDMASCLGRFHFRIYRIDTCRVGVTPVGVLVAIKQFLAFEIRAERLAVCDLPRALWLVSFVEVPSPQNSAVVPFSWRLAARADLKRCCGPLRYLPTLGTLPYLRQMTVRALRALTCTEPKIDPIRPRDTSIPHLRLIRTTGTGT